MLILGKVMLNKGFNSAERLGQSPVGTRNMEPPPFIYLLKIFLDQKQKVKQKIEYVVCNKKNATVQTDSRPQTYDLKSSSAAIAGKK